MQQFFVSEHIKAELRPIAVEFSLAAENRTQAPTQNHSATEGSVMDALQRIYDKIVTHLAEQGGPAWDPEREVCRFRIEREGRVLKCAVGGLIPEGWYYPELENNTHVEGDFWLRVLRYHEVEEQQLDRALGLVRQMQFAHDSYPLGGQLARSLKAIAESHMLDRRVVDDTRFEHVYGAAKQDNGTA